VAVTSTGRPLVTVAVAGVTVPPALGLATVLTVFVDPAKAGEARSSKPRTIVTALRMVITANPFACLAAPVPSGARNEQKK
jgi:hypothetical protein